GEQRWQRLGAEGPAEGDTTGDSGSNCEIRGKEFETYFSENDSGRRSTQQQGESFERRQAGGFGRETTGRTAREGSPTRVHVRRTGSVEIEHG
ncbi:unnamed protein product, partial [Sphacelaria rigidula]